MKKFIFGLAVALAVGTLSSASASILTFDDIAAGYPIGAYGGFTWTNTGVLDGTTVGGGASGYNGGVVSGTQVAYNGFGATAEAANGVFDFDGAYLAAAWNHDLSVRVRGYLGATLLYDTTVGVTYSTTTGASATWFGFGYTGIDKVVFDSFGGFDASSTDAGSGTQYAMDNFTFTEGAKIPEPTTLVIWSCLGLGLGLAAGRRRKVA